MRWTTSSGGSRSSRTFFVAATSWPSATYSSTRRRCLKTEISRMFSCLSIAPLGPPQNLQLHGDMAQLEACANSTPRLFISGCVQLWAFRRHRFVAAAARNCVRLPAAGVDRHRGRQVVVVDIHMSGAQPQGPARGQRLLSGSGGSRAAYGLAGQRQVGCHVWKVPLCHRRASQPVMPHRLHALVAVQSTNHVSSHWPGTPASTLAGTEKREMKKRGVRLVVRDGLGVDVAVEGVRDAADALWRDGQPQLLRGCRIRGMSMCVKDVVATHGNDLSIQSTGALCGRRDRQRPLLTCWPPHQCGLASRKSESRAQ